MTAKKAKKKSKQKDLYEVTVLDMRESQAKEVKQPEQVKQGEQVEQAEQRELPEQRKQAKQASSFILGAEVGLFLPGTGVEKLGRILRITSQLVSVTWDDGATERFSRTGHSFYGKVNSVGDPAKPLLEDQKIWGTDEDPHLTIPTNDAKLALAEKRKDKAVVF